MSYYLINILRELAKLVALSPKPFTPVFNWAELSHYECQCSVGSCYNSSTFVRVANVWAIFSLTIRTGIPIILTSRLLHLERGSIEEPVRQTPHEGEGH